MKDRISGEFKEVKKDIETYVNARIDLAKLHTAEGISKFISTILVRMVMLYLLFFVLLFASVAVAFWLGNIFENKGIGFVIVAGFYCLIGIVFLLLRKYLIERPVIHSVIYLFFPNYGNYDEEN